MGEEKQKRHWKKKFLVLLAAFGAVTAFMKKKKGEGDEAGWEEAKPTD